MKGLAAAMGAGPVRWNRRRRNPILLHLALTVTLSLACALLAMAAWRYGFAWSDESAGGLFPNAVTFQLFVTYWLGAAALAFAASLVFLRRVALVPAATVVFLFSAGASVGGALFLGPLAWPLGVVAMLASMAVCRWLERAA